MHLLWLFTCLSLSISTAVVIRAAEAKNFSDAQMSAARQA
jgi:hypothetical protein